ncbi:MAG: hypothetical protein A2X11_04325 [Bacteroidetes bacterium GWE2_42_24]|nr:MAG: hypothetical protein A2X11_04325 [Bacteroidetes bacterium GWE2_42_24]OFY25246.1 MAG: hypothetical protein A2X09_10970 [Bacteroidetes bacterium GWF2_43_11]
MKICLSVLRTAFLLLSTIFLLTSCATWYQKSQKFQAAVTTGNFKEAQKLIDKTRSEAEGKNRFLYFTNAGWVYQMTGRYDTSNYWLNRADLYIEDYQKSYGAEALALVTNPEVKPYAPEDPEKVMVNYYKAINYIEEGDMESALVETRRINIKLNELNDKYGKRKNRYSNDAFAHVLMGLIYDATNDYNNAFIAYRNAALVYDSLYTKQFGVTMPESLRQDLLRTSWLNGFNDELDRFQNQFNMKYKHDPLGERGQVVVLWENGFGPVKDEWSINFSIIHGGGGLVTFQSSELGISFPFFLGGKSSSTSFGDLDFVRVAFPKYLVRPPVFNAATLSGGGLSKSLDKAQDVSALLVKTLNDRMLREMANSLLRLAAKKSLESVVRDQDKTVGALFSIFNAVTEKSDTRNWQTLPAEIWYTRMMLPVGKQKITLSTSSGGGYGKDYEIEVDIKKGKTTFVTFRSLEAGLPTSVSYK